MAGRLPVVRGRVLLRALQGDGWYIARGKRHLVLKHPNKPGSVPIPNHPHKTVNEGTLGSILDRAGLTPERFRELL